MTDKEVGLREKGIFGWAVEATGGSGVMLYVQYASAQCDVFTVKRKATNQSQIYKPKRGKITKK